MFNINCFMSHIQADAKIVKDAFTNCSEHHTNLKCITYNNELGNVVKNAAEPTTKSWRRATHQHMRFPQKCYTIAIK